MGNEMMALPKSAMAEHAGSGTSDRYLFIPTTKVVSSLSDMGWEPSWSKETKTRSPQRMGFQKHLIRFRQVNPENEIRVGDSLAELLMVNAHDRSGRYQFRAGVYRFVCENGLIVSAAEFGAISVRHSGNLEAIMEASMKIVGRLPEVGDMIKEMGKKEVNDTIQLQMATKASEIRWGHDQKIIAPESLLVSRREEDNANDLWTVYNRIQENVIRGGMAGRGRQITAIRGMQRDLGLNEQLWNMAREVVAA